VAADTGIITTVAGSGPTGEANGGFRGDGGPATKARLNFPKGLAIDGAGNLFIADAFNHRIRKVAADTGIITTVAGSGPTGELNGSFSGDGGPATRASLNQPYGVAIDGAGNLLFSDAGNNRIRRVAADTGIITTFTGGGSPADGLGDGGPAVSA